MRYLSVCSGIDVASIAWRPLGWEPVLLSEVEAFPREVCRVRHGARDAQLVRTGGEVPLWGDFTAIRMRHLRRLGINPADIDLLVGGTPCQGFSVAGLRGSLSDPRGGLSLAFLRLAHAIQSVRARAGKPGLIIVWENVPGVLSTDDNALGCFLGALVGADDALRSPLERGRWPSAGMVAGPRARAAWRVLDAQHFGLAQRRARVFLVAGLGEGLDPAAVLFEPKSLRGDPAPGGETAEDVAPTLAGGARSSGGYSTDDVPYVACLNGLSEYGAGLPTLHAKGGDAAGGSESLLAFGGNRQSGPIDVATAVNAHGGPHGRLDFETETFIVTPFDTTQITSATNRCNPQPGDPCHPLAAQAHPPAIAFSCKDHGADAGDLAPTLRAMNFDGSHANGGGQVAAVTSSGVRRLMPVECERLQGVPDNFTRIPWRGRPASECPDGPRYRALGNAYPRPVMKWIGRRIDTAAAAQAAPTLQAAE